MSTLPDVLFCGDPHGKFSHIIEAVEDRRPDAIVLLGDITTTEPLSAVMRPVLELGCQVCWIPGNHDTDNDAYYDGLYGDEGAQGLIPIDRRVHTISGKNGGSLRIAGLGGVFRTKIWQPGMGGRQGTPPESSMTSQAFLKSMGKGNRWRGGMPLRHRSTIFPDAWLELSRLRADVLVTHEAPAFHPLGSAVLHELAVRMRAKYSFHGHHHVTQSYGVHDGVRAYGVGICSLLDLDGVTLVEHGIPIQAEF